jgi:signal peptidase
MNRSGARINRVLNGIVTGVLVMVLFGVVALLIAERSSSGPFKAKGGYFLATVLSGSMAPHINTGDVVVDRTVTMSQAEHLRVGQIVTYRTGQFFRGQPLLITHRIVGIVTVRNQATGFMARLYQTKGDANNAPDPKLVTPGQIVGVVAFRIPDAGYLSAFVRTPPGFALLIGLPIVFVVGEQFLKFWHLLDDAERRRRASSGSQQGGEDVR